MSRQFWVIVAVLVIAAAIYYPFSPGGRQRANMNRAEQHIPVLRAQLGSDPRFANVELSSYTGNGGSLLIRGEVASQDDADALKIIVDKSHPPSPVSFRVRARLNSATGPWE